MTERDEAILAHIGRYRLTLRDVLAHAFSLDHPGNVLQRLRDAGLVEQHDGLPGRVSYYQLTPRGACDRVSLERARPLRPEALRQHLAVVWFSHFGPHRAVRLEEDEVMTLFGERAPNARQVAYCLSEDETKRLLRVHVPGDAVPAARVVKTVRDLCAEFDRQGGEVAAWLAARSLGVAVLADSVERAAVIETALSATDLPSQFSVTVRTAPSPRTLSRFLNERRYPSSSHSGPRRS